MKTVFVISTMIINRKNFVAQNGRGINGLVGYTININAAKHFDSYKDAATFKDKISNPHSRVLEIEEAQVDPVKVQRAREYMDELK
jgi:hypothetical protein